MVSIYKRENLKTINNEIAANMELRGLSTDEKPTEINNIIIDNGSMFIEIDTGKLFLYDLENEEWEEI